MDRLMDGKTRGYSSVVERLLPKQDIVGSWAVE